MNKIKTLAIYLPQFHSIPENDKAWGEGFTEWTNVKKALPLFENHYQPHIPHNSVGYYDLSNPDILAKQAEMARKYGIYGFAYYHYWFNGKRLLNAPLDKMLGTGQPDFPFCYIWANENWTRKWDGFDDDVIIRQEYSFEDDRRHIRFLCKHVFSDKRYITIQGKPLFLVYRTNQFPDICRTTQLWREEARLAGYKDIYLVRVEAHGSNPDPVTIGFDSAMRFSPDWQMSGKGIQISGSDFSITKYDYYRIVLNTLLNKRPYKHFLCVFPFWDNSARRKHNSFVFENSSPSTFKYFLQKAIQFTSENFENDEKFLFINAWNEWGEGCHLEPDERFGFQYLQKCREAFNRDPVMFESGENYIGFLESEIQRLKEESMVLHKENSELSARVNYISGTTYFKIGQNIKHLIKRLGKKVRA